MRILLALGLAVALAGPVAADAARVRLLEGKGASSLTPEQLAEEVKGYLPAGAVDVGAVVPAPPAIDSPQDKADTDNVRAANAEANAARWERAKLDDASVYDRFTQQLGVAPDRRHVPEFVQLLNRVAADVFVVVADAKRRYPRPRPFQRFRLTRVCGQAAAPMPEASPSGGTSYPSGHAAVSWAVALVMMEASPKSAQSIILRAADYGESRVVCGVHYPSDVDAGHLLAAAVVDKLFALPEFRRDFLCAKRELQAVASGRKSADLPACPIAAGEAQVTAP